MIHPVRVTCLLLALACGPAESSPDAGPSTDAPTDGVDSAAADDSDTAVDRETDAGPAPVEPDDTGCDDGVDLRSDPLNCGRCGRTCVLPRAEAVCDEGTCAAGTCDIGWLDCDGEASTGCEAPDTCVPGAACESTCGGEGSISCADACVPVCAPPAEVCNAVDDDCDTRCDEGALPGCRVPVHRAYGAKGHLFTTDRAEWLAWGTPEAENFFYLYAAAAADLRPFFRCAKPNGSYFHTESNDCELTGAPRSTLGFIAPEPPRGRDATCGSVPLHRLYNEAGNTHFYTISATERDAAIANLGWVSQGIAGYVWTSP